ncbi:ABC transporter ATP-binding protein [Plantactinospora sonchi]|uniref:ABC transporter ATP-binding protein n=1 Tax=Plantactinospora sonchi TaxID=1544735 RepID=A0ABU7RVF5_9ACTN
MRGDGNGPGGTRAPDEATPVISVRQLSRAYQQGTTTVTALADVSTDFAAGRFTAIMGPSGSGKSTLLHCLAGLDRPTAGEVVLAGTALSRLSETARTRLRRDRLGFVFQAFNLVPILTVEENITLVERLGGHRLDHAWRDRLVALLGLADRLRHLPAQLSGGEQQRVAVARALVHRPAVVFADEPTGSLDSRTGGAVLRFLRQAVDEFGQTVVMVTHDPAAAAQADRVLLLRDGSIVADLATPTTDVLLSRLAALEAAA